MENESEATYTEFFNKLKARGLEKVWLCVSDAHAGLQAAIRKCFIVSVVKKKLNGTKSRKRLDLHDFFSKKLRTKIDTSLYIYSLIQILQVE